MKHLFDKCKWKIIIKNKSCVKLILEDNLIMVLTYKLVKIQIKYIKKIFIYYKYVRIFN